jgi:hypothetical protein
VDFCKKGGEGEAVIARECPGEARDRCKDVEERYKNDDAEHDDKEVSGGLGACSLIVDLDDGQEVCGDDFNVADGEEDGDHVGELHDSVEDDGGDHRERHTEAGFLDFVGHVKDAIEAWWCVSVSH